MFRFLLFSLLLIGISCGQSSSSSAPASAPNLVGYEVTDLGNGISKAIKLSGSTVVEEGLLLNGLKNGNWTTYHAENGRVHTITSFANGKKNGVYIEMTKRGQMEKRINYTNDVMDGRYAEYAYGTRTVKEVDYNNGKIDGFFRDYHGNGKLRKEVQFKNGIQDGSFKQYNDSEELIMQYEYKNGEKVSGGLTE